MFDGLKSFISFQLCYSMAFFCAYYQIIQFPDDAEQVYQNFFYVTLIEGMFQSTKVLLLIAGFLQTLSFFLKYGNNPTLGDVLKFIGLRIMRVAPVYTFCLIYIIFA